MKRVLARAAALATVFWLPEMSAWSSEVDVTSQVSLAYSGYVYNRGSGTFDTQATLTNHQSALASPVELVVTGLPANVALANASGKTASGTPFINVGGAGIAQGASASVILKFSDPLHATVSFKAQVLAATSGGSSGGSLTPAQRDAALTAMELQWNQVVNSGADFVSSMLQYLQSRPEVTNVAADGEGGVTAQFIDGRLLSVQHNLSVVRSAASASVSLRGLRPEAATAATLIPGGKKAVIASGFGADYPAFVSINDNVRTWLQSAGYTVVPGGTGATPAFLRANLSNVDVLLYTGHGGATVAKVPTIDHFGIATGVVKSTNPGSPQQFPAETPDDTDDFNTFRLGYQINTVATDPKDNEVAGTWWAFTDQFVATYMSFQRGSFVFMNACFSQGEHANAGFVITALTRGAGTYLGWNGKTSDTGGMRPRYLFDRMLGEADGVTRDGVTPESPPQRPFDLAAVVQDLTAQGLLPLANQSTLVTSGLNSILAPSIAALTVDNLNNRLLVTGIFDTSPTALQDTVISVGGQPVCPSAQSVDADTIACPIPFTGAQSAGPVTVSTHGIQSNTVNLSSWQGTFVQEKDGGGSIKETADMFAHWRGDIHAWRIKPHTPPKHYNREFIVDADSTLNWSISGTQTVKGPPDQTVTVSGGSSLPLVGPGFTTPPYFSMGIVIDTDVHEAYLLPTGLAQNAIHVSGNACKGPASFTFLISPALLTSVGIWVPPPPATNAEQLLVLGALTPLDSDFSLTAQGLAGAPEFGCPYSIGGNVTSKFTVPSAKISFPPDPKAAQ